MQYADTSTFGYGGGSGYYWYIDEVPPCLLCDKYPCRCPVEVTDEQWIYLTGSRLIDILRWLYNEYGGLVHVLFVSAQCRSPTIKDEY